MRTTEIIKEIQLLPNVEKMYVVEKTLHTIRVDEEKIKPKNAADSLLDDYSNDKELTAFTNIDFEDFYETK